MSGASVGTISTDVYVGLQFERTTSTECDSASCVSIRDPSVERTVHVSGPIHFPRRLEPPPGVPRAVSSCLSWGIRMKTQVMMSGDGSTYFLFDALVFMNPKSFPPMVSMPMRSTFTGRFVHMSYTHMREIPV